MDNLELIKMLDEVKKFNGDDFDGKFGSMLDETVRHPSDFNNDLNSIDRIDIVFGGDDEYTVGKVLSIFSDGSIKELKPEGMKTPTRIRKHTLGVRVVYKSEQGAPFFEGYYFHKGHTIKHIGTIQ